ncbi:MAG: DUF1501 domain-containing protein [Actinomycetota bacterium]|nr:DUF1501 domain-containing protein [Actinomycetota bacterium]
MPDSSLSTADIRRRLSVPIAEEAPGPGGWTRRSFLQAVGLGAGAAAAGGLLHELAFGADTRTAFAGQPLGTHEGVLVLLTHYGGNDGLNMVVPYTNNDYYGMRGGLAIPANQVLPLDGVHALHPALSTLKSMWDAHHVAIVHGSGYPNPDLSHFSSMATWMHGSLAGGAITSGWVGRWLDGLAPDLAEMAAASIDSAVPLSLQGRTRGGLGVSPWGNLFGADSGDENQRMYNALSAMNTPAGRGPWHDMFSSALATQLRVASELAPSLDPEPQGSDLVRRMTIAARIINANVGLRVIDVPHGGYDTHEGQPGRHEELLGDFDTALATFYATLSPAYHRRVLIVTLSEFGRTPYANQSLGTDHGTANVQMVIGHQVRGGHYGTPPSLNVADQWDRLVSTLDFRSVLGTLVEGWMGADAGEVMEGNSFERLNFLAAAPGVVELTKTIDDGADQSGLMPAVRVRG